MKQDRAVKCLTKDRADIRTANPKSTFATVRHRTTKAKVHLSRNAALAMTNQLMLSAK